MSMGDQDHEPEEKGFDPNSVSDLEIGLPNAARGGEPAVPSVAGSVRDGAETPARDAPRKFPLIQCLHIHKSFGEDREVFRGACLQLNKGEFVFLIGPSGAGKTTLIRCILGLEPISQGNIVVDGMNVQRLSPRELAMARRRMGVISEDFKLPAHRSVFENVALPLRIMGRSREFIHRRVQQVLEFVEMEGKAQAVCAGLPGGEQRRVAMARAVVNDPAIILADEPTSNLDEESSLATMNLLKEIHLRRATILLATHDHSLPLIIPEGRTAQIRQLRIEEMPTAGIPFLVIHKRGDRD